MGEMARKVIKVTKVKKDIGGNQDIVDQLEIGVLKEIKEHRVIKD